MEFFTKSKLVNLRSHLDKYLIDDNGKLRQSRNGTVKRAQWTVEKVEAFETHRHVVRLKSFNGKYLTATETPFRLGVTGKAVILTELEEGLDGKNEWEPIRDGFQVKFRSYCGKYLRGNGGAPPWRNSVTHDDSDSSVSKGCFLWDVETVMEKDVNELFSESFLASFASDDVSVNSDTASPMSVFSLKSPPARRNLQLQVRLPILCLLFCCICFLSGRRKLNFHFFISIFSTLLKIAVSFRELSSITKFVTFIL